LNSGKWKPDPYAIFFVQDPKLRKIHKESVRDRVLYQALYRVLYQIFDSSFVHDIYSSRNFRGTHAGVARLEEFSRKMTSNHTRSAFALKCDIRKFFDSIDHKILFELISEKIENKKLLELIWEIIDSFHHTKGKGLPLGNVTSQLFANIYMNRFDQYIKHVLKARYYIRYCDDFVILDQSQGSLETMIPDISSFLLKELSLDLHPRKVEIRKIIQGIDFLGYVAKPYYRVLRTSTKNRLIRKIKENKKLYDSGQIAKEKFDAIVASYLGMLSHCRAKSIKSSIDMILKS
jgi:retron-type reverse transcriptase